MNINTVDMTWQQSASRKAFAPEMAEAFMEMFISRHPIGVGASRVVFPLWMDFGKNENKDLVIKIAYEKDVSFNVNEYETWQAVVHTEHSKWFAPVISMSKCGKLLIQKRTEPITIPPEKIPAYMTDVKLSNWGMLNGKPVCHDYGSSGKLLTMGLTKRMQNWESIVHPG